MERLLTLASITAAIILISLVVVKSGAATHFEDHRSKAQESQNTVFKDAQTRPVVSSTPVLAFDKHAGGTESIRSHGEPDDHSRHGPQRPRLAVLGDSLSAPYKFFHWGMGQTKATGWLEVLQAAQRCDLGSEQTAEVARNRGGYSGIWARPGLSTGQAIALNWHREMAKAIQDDKFDLVVVALGADNFAPYYQRWVQQGDLPDAEEIDTTVTELEISFIRIMDVLQRACRASVQTRLCIATIPDWTQTPLMRLLDLPVAARNRLRAAIERANDAIVRQAAVREIPILDFYGHFNKLCRYPKHDLHGIDVAMGSALEYRGPAFFLADGMHPSSFGSVIIANYFLQTFCQMAGKPAQGLSAQEVSQVLPLGTQTASKPVY